MPASITLPVTEMPVEITAPVTEMAAPAVAETTAQACKQAHINTTANILKMDISGLGAVNFTILRNGLHTNLTILQH